MADASINGALSDVVEVNVTLNSPTVSEVDFQLCNLFQTDILIITPAERFRIYESAAEVADDFPGNSDNELYVKACASVLFGQEGSRPAQLMITTVDLVGGETYAEIALSVYELKGYTIGTVADLAIDFAAIQAILLSTLSLPLAFGFLRTAAQILSEGPVLSPANQSRCFYMEGDVLIPATDTNRREMAMIGKCIAQPIGTVNWALQTLRGVSPTSLGITNQDAMLAEKANVYGLVGGLAITRNGTVMSNAVPNFIDQRRCEDYLKDQLQLAIYNSLINGGSFGQGGIPYTQRGFNYIDHQIRAVLNVLSAAVITTAFDVEIPIAALATEAQRAARVTPPFKVFAELQGFLNKVIINVSLTI